MDILMIYWNSVWTNSQRETVSLLADHSSDEMRAFERRLHPAEAKANETARPPLRVVN